MIRILEAIAGIKELPVEDVAKTVYDNTLKFFSVEEDGKIKAKAWSHIFKYNVYTFVIFVYLVYFWFIVK